MRRIVFPAVFASMMLLLTSCPGGGSIEHIDLGSFPEQYIATVPYADGDVFKMQHETSKLIIEFTVARNRVACSEAGYGTAKFSPAPSCYYDFEEDMTVCRPNYPLFDISITMSNFYLTDSVMFGKKAHIQGVGHASLPFIGEDTTGYTISDSLEINGKIYNDVFKLESQYYGDEENTHVDKYLYNYEKGFVGIIMSNGEKFYLYED